jgi:hypothetical protein
MGADGRRLASGDAVCGSGELKKGGREEFLTARGSFGGRESGGEGSDSGDRRRRPEIEVVGGELGWRH